MCSVAVASSWFSHFQEPPMGILRFSVTFVSRLMQHVVSIVRWRFLVMSLFCLVLVDGSFLWYPLECHEASRKVGDDDV